MISCKFLKVAQSITFIAPNIDMEFGYIFILILSKSSSSENTLSLYIYIQWMSKINNSVYMYLIRLIYPEVMKYNICNHISIETTNNFQYLHRLSANKARVVRWFIKGECIRHLRNHKQCNYGTELNLFDAIGITKQVNRSDTIKRVRKKYWSLRPVCLASTQWVRCVALFLQY